MNDKLFVTLEDCILLNEAIREYDIGGPNFDTDKTAEFLAKVNTLYVRAIERREMARNRETTRGWGR